MPKKKTEEIKEETVEEMKEYEVIVPFYDGTRHEVGEIITNITEELLRRNLVKEK